MKNALRSGKTYETAFICVMGVLILYWIASIVLNGSESQQFNLFFSKMEDFLADATNVVGYSSQRDPYNNTMYSGLSQKAYPPLVYMIMYFFSRLVDMAPYYEANYFKNMYTEPLFLTVYSVFTGLVLLLGYELIKNEKTGSSLIKIGTALSLLLSGPMLFSLERGNVIIWIPFLCMLFLMFYDSNNKVLKEIGLIALAIAAGVKLMPALLGILLILERKWKEALRAVIYGICAVFLPFLFFKGGLDNISLMFRNMGYLMEEFKALDGCSVRNLLLITGNILSLNFSEKTITATTVVIGLILIAGVVLSRCFWERVLALSLIMVTLPSSGYYYSIYLIPVTILFLNEEKHRKSDVFVLLALLLIFSPIQSILQNYYIDYHLGFLVLLLTVVIRTIAAGINNGLSVKLTT